MIARPVERRLHFGGSPRPRATPATTYGPRGTKVIGVVVWWTSARVATVRTGIRTLCRQAAFAAASLRSYSSVSRYCEFPSCMGGAS